MLLPWISQNWWEQKKSESFRSEFWFGLIFTSLSFCWHETEIQTQSTYQAYFHWGERSKRKSCMLSLLSRLIFSETLLELCLACRWFQQQPSPSLYRNMSYREAGKHVQPLEMSISDCFAFGKSPLLSMASAVCDFESNGGSRTIVCVRSHVDLWAAQPGMESCFSMAMEFLSPLQSLRQHPGEVLGQLMPSKGHFCTRHISSSHEKQ